MPFNLSEEVLVKEKEEAEDKSKTSNYLNVPHLDLVSEFD